MANALATTATLDESNWDEAQCKASLARLEKLQNQVDTLRLTIPNIIHALAATKTYSSPEQLYRALNHAIVGGSSALVHLRTAWNDPQTNKLLEHVKRSYQENADLSAGAKIQRYGWADEAKLESGADIVAPTQSEQAQSTIEEEDVGKIVDGYKQINPTFKVDYDEQAHRIEASNLNI
ncbi:hypothetical protein LTS18_008520 [Coniosporium uncinatum]|uniref:Uncharacterized protein n=1 Tax=Coniosporium uncinatum TaxID=93489 RepID=A0ACC3DNJ0_9PEZI|nr:hypothetical protein LTS18_008520 [Coniosporium uncinatum]